MRFLSIIGTRPQYIKLSAMIEASNELKIVHDWLDTGQHYSKELSENLINEKKLIQPILNLRVGSGSHAEQTAKIMIALESFLIENKYEMVLIYGDTNSTLAAVLTCAKLGIPTAHIEAGLRSNNLYMPEEINRKVADSISSYLFAPSNQALINLRNEGHTNCYFSGDVMFDIAKRYVSERNKQNQTQEHFLCTLHRAENMNIQRVGLILSRLSKLEANVLLPAHPRLRAILELLDTDLGKTNVKIIEPLAHEELLLTISNSIAVVTDSGGVQKEAYFLGKKCITVRNETEWTETVGSGWNILDPNLENIEDFMRSPAPKEHLDFYGDGRAAFNIFTKIKELVASDM